ncbi:MAG TPA: RNA-binding protein [Candidatus Angelobacter sp.]|jgi:RNA recognition motif-containing protein|nr:RNA-binding protein [Candidatus Angelobacter sp.]
MKKIFVGNFSFSLTEGELRSMFEPFGAIDSATVVTDRATGRSRGFGFVEMSNNEEAEKAITALNGKDSGGRALTVNEARPKVGGGGGGGGYRGGGGGSRGGGGGGGRDRDRGGNSRDDYQGHARQPREPRW